MKTINQKEKELLLLILDGKKWNPSKIIQRLYTQSPNTIYLSLSRLTGREILIKEKERPYGKRKGVHTYYRINQNETDLINELELEKEFMEYSNSLDNEAAA